MAAVLNAQASGAAPSWVARLGSAALAALLSIVVGAFAGGAASAQAISSPVVIDFDAEPFVDGSDFGSSTFTQSGFTITYSAKNFGEDTNECDTGNCLIVNQGSGVDTVTLETTGGEEFSLTSFWYDHFDFGLGGGFFTNDINQIEGFRDGVSTGVITAGLPVLARRATFVFDAANLDPAGVLDNVDRVVMTSNDGHFGGYDTFSMGLPILPPDTTAPTVSSVVRQTPPTTPTNADSLIFRVTFDEDVQNVDAADFDASGTSGDATAVSSVNASTYDVTVSGGDLAGYEGAVALTFAAGQNIEDLAGNALTNTTPTGANESYTLDNTSFGVVFILRHTPASEDTNADALTFLIQFTEAAVFNITADDFAPTGGTTATATGLTTLGSGQYTVTVSGGDLASFNGTVGLGFSGSNDISDAAGNIVVPTPITDNFTYTLDNAGPSLAVVTPVTSPTSDATPAFTFSTNEAGTLAVGGTCGTSSSTTISAAGDRTITLTATDNASPLADGTYNTCTVTMTDGLGNVSSALAIPAFTVDTAAPTASAFTRQTPAAAVTNADTLVFRAAFSEDMDPASVQAADFALSGPAAGSATISAVTQVAGDPSRYDVEVGGVASADGALNLDLAGSASLTDAAGNALSGGEPGTDESYTLDNTVPSVSAIALTGGPYAPTATSIDFFVVFNESVSNVTDDDFTLTETGSATGTVASVAGSGSSRTVTVNAISGTGSLRLDFAANTDVVDALGNGNGTNGFVAAANGGSVHTVDADAPGVVDIRRISPTASAINGSVSSVTFEVTFSEGIDASSVAPGDFTVTGAVTGTVNSASASSGAAVEVVVGALSGDGTLGLSVTGSISDDDGNASTGTLTPSGLNETYTRDGTAPVLQAFERQTPASALTNADTLVFDITFSESVTGVGASDFAVTGPTATAVLGGSGAAYTLTLSGGTLPGYDGTVGLDLATGHAIADAAGNALPDAEPATDETYTLDNTAPSGYTVSLDQDPVTAANETAISFTFAGAEVGADYSYTLTSSGGAGSVSGSGTLATATDQISSIDVSGLADGTLTLSATLSDALGNPGTAATDTAVKDAAAPRLSTISRQSPTAETTNADAPVFRVVFSEAMDVATVNAADFSVSGAGASGASLAVASVSATTFDVTASGIASNDGALDLALAGSPTLDDAGGNTLSNTTALGAVEGFILDNTAPAVTSITLAGGEAPADADVTYTVSFSESVDNITADDFTLTTTGGASAAIASVSASSGTSVTVTVDTIDGTGTLRLDLAAGTDIADGAGNTSPAAFNTGDVHTVDRSLPSVASITLSGSPAPGDASVSYAVTFSEAVNNISTDDFALTTTGSASAAIASVSAASGTSVTVTVDTIAGEGSLRLDLLAGTDIEDGSGNAGPPAFTSGDVHVIDRVAPSAISFVRAGGAAEITNADTLDWTVTFSEAVSGVDGADFALTASSASLAVTGSGDTWTVTASGGDLAGFNGAVGLDVSGSAAFADAAGNAGAITEPATDEGYVVDNDSPVLTAFARNTPADEITDADTLVFDVTFSKPVINVTADDFEATGTTATAALAGSGAAYTITLSGGDLAELNGVVGLDLAAVQDIADTAGNALLAAEPASDETYTLQNDTEAPRLASVTRLTPADAITAADTLVFQVSFSEDVANVTADDFAASASSAAASGISGVSASVYEVTLSGGDLAGFDGTVGLELASGQDIADLAGNALTDPAVTGADESYTLDNTAPAVTLSRAGSDPVSGAFELTITFTEAVSGFELSDITVAGGAVSDLATDDDTVFTATVTPSGDGTVTLDVAEGAAADAAGNASTAAETLEVEADATAPELAIALPGETTTGVFTASFTFTEAVAGFALDDIAVTNGAASDLASEDDTVFTATITPQAPGTVTIDVAEGAAADAAGNPSTAAGTSIEAVAEAEAVVLELTAATAEPGSVAASVNLTNPGSDPLSFNASADVDWLDVSPASGTVPSLGALALTIALNDAVNALEPGDYTGTVTVSTASGAAGTASTGAVLVQIPVSLSVAQRFGSITLVATTPSGASGEASFTYASDIEAFNGLTLTTSGGRASASVSEALFGTYALSQSLPAGWRVESIACAGDLDGGSSVNVEAGSASLDLDPGESLVCTFENVRDEEAVRIATQRAIRNFMVRRADQIMQAAPDLSRRFEERGTTQRGGFGADMDGSGRYQMAFTTSLSGLRNAAAAAQDGAAQFANPERPFLDGWDVWIAAEVSGVSDNRAGERAESDFGVAQLGVDYQLRPDLIVGALAQYDWMSETAQDIFEEAGAVRGARVEGEGWMAGPYAVWRIRDSLILDGLALYGQSDNQVDPLGLYEDDFETDRFMLRANLTGEFASGAWRLRPQAGLTHFEETQAAYTDSLGIAIPEQTIAIGRLRAGPEVAWRSAGERGSWFEVRTAVNAVWDYQAADLLSETGQLTGGDESLRADARFGLAALTRWGALIGIETGYAGLGQGDFEARSLRLEIRIPFGAAGSGGGASLTGAAGALFGPECGGVHAGYDQAFAGAGGCADPGFGAVQQP